MIHLIVVLNNGKQEHYSFFCVYSIVDFIPKMRHTDAEIGALEIPTFQGGTFLKTLYFLMLLPKNIQTLRHENFQA